MILIYLESLKPYKNAIQMIHRSNDLGLYDFFEEQKNYCLSTRTRYILEPYCLFTFKKGNKPLIVFNKTHS